MSVLYIFDCLYDEAGRSLIECKDFLLLLKFGVVVKTTGSAHDLTEAEKQEILELIEKDKKAWDAVSFDHSLFRRKRFKI